MKKMVTGELTAFLSLVFLLLISLVGSVLESASVQGMKNEKRADASRAAESVFAEYQRDLLEGYEIFALEASYESGDMSESDILNRLAFYGAENMEIDMESVRYITDQNGQEFYRQAVAYEKERTGAAAAERLLGDLPVWREQERQTEEYGKEEQRTKDSLNQILRGEAQGLPEEENPLKIVGEVRTGLLLDVVLPKGFDVSKKAVDRSRTVTGRELREGRGSLEGQSPGSGSAIFFNLYLAEKFGHAREKKEGTALDYELEYLLAGKAADAQNLEAAVKKICALRFAANYTYILTDAAKKQEAGMLAMTLCTLLAAPEAAEVVKHAVLLAWAYGEGVMDVRALLAGKRVPLVKTEQTWQLSMAGLLTLNRPGGGRETADAKDGYTYEQYLQAMLFLCKKEVLTMRALDLVEQNIQVKEGKEFFKADACVTGAVFKIDCPMRRGIHYRFRTTYQYR